MNNREKVLGLLIHQLDFFGGLSNAELGVLHAHVGEVIQQVSECCSRFASLPNRFNFYQTHHSAIFLYKLSRVIHEKSKSEGLATKLYLLNRMLNGVDMYFKINLPKNLIVGHGLGTVFSSAMYGDYLVVFQGSTIGVSSGNYPKIGAQVVVYPNCVIAGKTVIGNNSVVSAGTVLIDQVIPENSMVFRGSPITVKENKKNLIGTYFTLD